MIVHAVIQSRAHARVSRLVVGRDDAPRLSVLAGAGVVGLRSSCLPAFVVVWFSVCAAFDLNGFGSRIIWLGVVC